MKRILATILLAALLIAVAVPAMASDSRYINKNGVKVYKDPDKNSKVLKKLDKGTKVTALDCIGDGSGWWYISFKSNGKKKNGWVLGKYLSEKKIKPKATAKPKPTVNPQIAIDAVMDTMRTVEAYPAEVTTKTENGTVALRMQPTTNGKLIYNIPNRHAITVLAEGDGWFQVRDDETGSTGFMSSKYITAMAEVEEEEADEPVEVESIAKTVAPQPVEVDLDNLADGEYPVSFDRANVISDENGLRIENAHIYTVDWYDIVDINSLVVGDTIVIDGKEVLIQTLSREENVLINEDSDEGGWVLFNPEDSNGFRVLQDDDYPTYTDHGATTLTFADTATFEDGWDIEAEPVTTDYAGIADAIAQSEMDAFDVLNTTARVEGGKVVSLVRIYTP